MLQFSPQGGTWHRRLMLKVTSCGRKCAANKPKPGSAHDRRHIMTSPGHTGISRRDIQTSAPNVYFHVCETQRTPMHVTDTTATPNGHQMAVVTWDRYCKRPGVLCNIGYQPGIHHKPKSREDSVAYNLFISHPIVINFCTGHGSDTVVLCVKFQSDWINETVVMDERDCQIWV